MFYIGRIYLWAGDKDCPSFYTDHSMNQVEYAENGFTMKYGDRSVEYLKGILKPRYRSNCVCISTTPLTFKVEDIESLIVEDNFKIQHCDIIRQTMEGLGFTICDLGINAIAEIIIPRKFEGKPITEQLVKQAMIEYLVNGVGVEYAGNLNNYTDHIKRLEVLLTAVFGSRIAYAISKLSDTGDVRVTFKDNKFTAYYKDEEMSKFLSNVESIINS